MSLTKKEIELVAIGASIGGNCIPCLEYHYEKCVELGFTKQELTKAIAVAKKVKEVPNQKIYEAADRLEGASHSEKKEKIGKKGSDGECDCCAIK
jgi:4-carboxymuconolactone decarboxylase